MLRCLQPFAVLIFTFTVLSVPAFAQAPEKQVAKPAFDADSRLDRRITVDQTGVSLEGLLAKLSSPDLALSVSPNCATQRLQIALHDRPLRVLLRSIAELMPGSWTPDATGHGYRFSMSDKAVAQREEWWQLYRKQHDASLEAQRRFIVDTLEAHPKQGTVHQMSGQQLQQMRDANTFYRELSHDQKMSIARQMIDTTMYTIGVLSSDGSMQEAELTIPLTEVPDAARQAVRSANARFLELNHLTDSDVSLNIANEGHNLMMHLRQSNGKEGLAAPGISLGIAPEAAPLTLQHGELVRAVKKRGQEAPPDWKRLAAFQEGRVWPNDPPPPHMRAMYGLGAPRLAECLNYLKDGSHLEFVSDYYDLSGTTLGAVSDPRKADMVAGPIPVQLNKLAEQQDLSWKATEGGIYLLRNNRWYRDDALQVSSDQLALWSIELPPNLPVLQYRMLPSEPAAMKARMDLEAKIATELSPYQIAVGLQWHAVDSRPENAPARTLFPFAGLAHSLLNERYTALFYASLNDTDRIALIEGRLPFSKLTAEQQRQAVFLKPSLQHQPPEKAVWLYLNDAPQPAGVLAIPGGPLRGVRLELVTPPATIHP